MLIRKLINGISISILILLISLGFIGVTSWWMISIVIVPWLMITVYGVCNIDSQYFVKSYCKADKYQKKAIAITFDDGPHENTVAILELLKAYNAKATFFCIGKQIEKYPDILKKIEEEGHLIGNHTYSHSKTIDLYNAKKFSKEILDTDHAIAGIIGKKPLLFRPPYGVTNPDIARALKVTKHKVIGWNKRSFDTSTKSTTKVLKRITKNLTSGDIILLHDTQIKTRETLEQLLVYLKKHSFETVDVATLLGVEAYQAGDIKND